MSTVSNIALLTECRLLSNSSAINMSLLWSEAQEEFDHVSFAAEPTAFLTVRNAGDTPRS